MGSLKIHPQIRIDEYTKSGVWTQDTVQQLLADRVRERGNQLAVVDPVDKSDYVDAVPGRITWAELDGEVDRLAATLLRSGVRAGEVIGVQLPNTIEQVVVILAAWRIGAIVSLLAIESVEREIVELCNESCASAFVTAARIGSNHVAERVISARSQIPTMRTVFSYGVGVPDGVVRIGHGVPTAADAAEVAANGAVDRAAPDDCIAICWTSGTEGAVKGVPHAHCESLAHARGVVEAAGLTADDVVLNPFPMMTSAGIIGTMLPWLSTGCILVQHQPFRLDVFVRQIAEEKVTYTAGRPSMLASVESCEGPAVDLSTLTRVGVGAGHLAPETVQRWRDRHGVQLVNFFGTIEGVSLRSDPDARSSDHPRALLYPRCGDGRGTVLKLVDQQTGAEITEPGVLGELRVTGPTVFAGYLNPARDRDPFDAEGFLMTGDLFVIDGPDDAYLRFVDRASDIIRRGGVRIGSVDLEVIIAEHPAVSEVAVIGCPEGRVGEQVVAVVACSPGAVLSLEEIVQFLEDRGVDPGETPQRLVIAKGRAGLPRSSTGKVLKRVLREELGRG
ncbi:acyl-CoA synthetase (AMP-forming)/AMP-acid ligase II [Rhodococcus sp. OK519]|uniref:class I adenylate-forming enzyme family protein n=1 Tax=Rhodococcus sp. OK519 TaxID=2135729 RepID=UPI000D3A8077|nr:acyl-CoA synthetase (AMP-forming)/AMP-acid ligase II [Rhodococcus sp. OK519]